MIDEARAIESAIARITGGEGDRDADSALRWLRAMSEMLSGYRDDPADILKAQFKVAEPPGPIIVRDIEFTSICRHHYLPFSGTANVGYIPAENDVIGLSKLSRLFQCFARRLQLQEQIGMQVVSALRAHGPAIIAAGVVIRASHTCMQCRGARERRAVMQTQFIKSEVDEYGNILRFALFNG